MNNKKILDSLKNNIKQAYALHRIITDEAGEPADYIFLDVNELFYKFTGLGEFDVINKRVTEVIPTIKTSEFNWVAEYAEVAFNGVVKEFEQYSSSIGKWFIIKVFSPESGYFVTLFDVIDSTNEIEFQKLMLRKDFYKRLSKISVEIGKIEDKINLFNYIMDTLSRELPDDIILFNEADETSEYLQLRKVMGMEGTLMSKIMNVLKFDPYNKKYKIIEKFKEYYHSESLHEHIGGFFEFSKSEVPKIAAMAIESILKIKKIYTIGLLSGKRILGNVHFFIRSDRDIPNKEFIESLIHLFSANLERIYTQEKLVKALDNYEWKNWELETAKAELQSSEERWKFALEGSNSGVWDWNLETNEVFFSTRWKTMLGFEENEIENNLSEWEKRVHPDDIEQVYEDIKRHLNEDSEIYQNEHRVLCKDGSYKWILDQGKVVEFKENGKPFRMIGTHLDLTERKKIEEKIRKSEEKYRLITEFASDVIWVLNLTQKRFTYISPSIFQLRGLTVEEALAEPLDKALTPDSLEDVLKAIEKNLKLFIENPAVQNYYFDEVKQPCKDGSVIWIEVSTKFRYNSEGEIEIIGVSRNIEERKQKENEIKRLLSEITESRDLLEQNLFQKNALLVELEQIKTQLENTIAEKDKFFSIIAHDLRSPFSGLLGLLQMLNNPSYDIAPSERDEIIALLYDTTKNVFALIENLLDWSRLQRGVYPYFPVKMPLNVLLRQIIETMESNAKLKEISIHQDIQQDISVTADPDMINTVFRNIISNAVKFTKRGGKIYITAKEVEGEVHTSVKDTGIGIKPEYFDDLFTINKSTYRTGTEGEKSTGLGLVLCKEIMDKSGGRISVDSEIGKGSVFNIILPKGN